ncbi:MAG: hypothetical protein II811_04105 [Spirochaetaceae bacterium]|nr:hypothetical protein [Spirochaetaceae bacterium]
MENKRGGARNGAGRKRLYTGGRQQLTISLSKEQKDAIKTAAENQNISVAAYILQKCGL